MTTRTKVSYEQRMSQEHQRRVAMRRADELAGDEAARVAHNELVAKVEREGIAAHVLTDEDLDRILA